MSDVIPHGGVSNLYSGGLDAPLQAKAGSPAAAPDLGFAPLPWMDEALCTQAPAEMFFPDDTDHAMAFKAKRICRECPVKQTCLEFGLHQQHGVWGGLTPRERQRLRKGAAA